MLLFSSFIFSYCNYSYKLSCFKRESYFSEEMKRICFEKYGKIVIHEIIIKEKLKLKILKYIKVVLEHVIIRIFLGFSYPH